MPTETNIQEVFELFMRSRQDSVPHCVTPARDGMYRDAILGVVVGDAVGVPFESGWRDTYTATDMTDVAHGASTCHKEPLPIGTWSDDSCLTFATIDHLRKHRTTDTEDLMLRFCAWYYGNSYTPQGQKRFGEGKTTVRALEAFKSGMPADRCGSADDTATRNGSLMRILPLAFYPHSADEIAKISAVTHAHPLAIMACICYVEIAENLIGGKEKLAAVREIRWPQCEAFSRMAAISEYTRDEIRSSANVIETLEAALWCFLTTDNYRDCILTAVNLGRDTDTVAAIAGGLAGMYYQGDNGIPTQWIENLQPGYEEYIRFEETELCIEQWDFYRPIFRTE